jgi:hypothetical protein
LFRLFGLFIFFAQFQNIFGQEFTDGENSNVGVVYVEHNVQIYSEDKSFNSHIRYLESEKKSLTPVNAKSDTLKNKFKKESDLAVKEIKQLILDDTKKKEEKFKTDKVSFLHENLYSSVPSDDFFGSKTAFKDYVAPRPCNQDQCKDICLSESPLIKKGLVYFCTQQFVYYSNRSLDNFLFSFIYARPPPVLL